MLQEDEVAGEQHAGRLVEDREIAVGVRGRRPRGEPQTPAAEVQRGLGIHQQGWRNDPDGGDGRLAELFPIRAQVIGTALGEFRRQVAVSDERRAGRHGRIAEHVVGMFVRVDHIANRFVGDGVDRQQQTLADGDAAAGVDQGNGVVSDDDAEIGDVARVVRRRECDLSEMCVIAVRDLLHRQRCIGLRRRGGAE